MEGLWQDLGYALRGLRKRTGFTVAAVATLALAIGANTAIFSVVNAVLLRQLPFREPERIVYIESKRPDGIRYGFNLPDAMDYRGQTRTLEQAAAYTSTNVIMTGQGEAERLWGLRASANLFEMLGVKATMGRLLTPEDDVPGRARVTVLSYGLWQSRFGSDPHLVGKSLDLNGASYTVVGILPKDFPILVRDIDLTIPLVPDADPWRNNRGSTSFLRLAGRLKPGVTLQQAEGELTAIALRLKQEFPEENAEKVAAVASPLADQIVGHFRASLWVLLGAVGAVLLIACANLANLSLVQGSGRHREMAIRTALGA